MLKKFKLEALTLRRCKREGLVHVRAKYIIKARNPFEAIDKLQVKYPGRWLVKLGECWPNGNYIFGKTWGIDYLNKHKEEIMIKYDLES